MSVHNNVCVHTTQTHRVIIKKNYVFYFLNQSTVKPLLLLNLIFYKLDINVIRGPSQNASWSVLQRDLFTLYKTLHTWSSAHQKAPRALSQNKNVQKRKKMISSHFLYSSSFHLKMHISHPSAQKPTFFLINFLNYYCVIRQAEVTVSWSVRSRWSIQRVCPSLRPL